MNLRPINPSNSGATFYELYQDPGFMINEPVKAQLNPPFNNGIQNQEYRMKLSKYSDTKISLTSYFWNGSLWQDMTTKGTQTLPLLMDYTDELATFEAINIQFRRNGSSINAVTLSQQIGNNSNTSIPEPGMILGLLGVGILSKKFKKRGN